VADAAFLRCEVLANHKREEPLHSAHWLTERYRVILVAVIGEPAAGRDPAERPEAVVGSSGLGVFTDGIDPTEKE
jgi:hypothetical protein